MAGVIKRNPLAATQAWEVIGKKITWFEVSATNITDYDPTPVAPNDEPAEYQVGWEADGAVNALIAVIQKTTTIIAMGPIQTEVFSIGVEGIFTGKDNFDGTADDGDLHRMQADIQALGTVTGHIADGSDNSAGVDLSGTLIKSSEFTLDPAKTTAV